jgi:hypothetical protein
MQKLAITLAASAAFCFSVVALAVGLSGAAYAGDATAGNRSTTIGPSAMSDSEMDNVTAGDPGVLEMCNAQNCQVVGAGPNGQGIDQRLRSNGYYNSNDNRGAHFTTAP